MELGNAVANRATSLGDHMNRTMQHVYTSLAAAAIVNSACLADVRVWAWGPINSEYHDTMTPMVCAFPNADPVLIAQQLRTRPPGARVLLIANMTEELVENPNDRCRSLQPDGSIAITSFRGPWVTAGESALRIKMSAFFEALLTAGAEIDSLVLDNETDLAADQFFGESGDNFNAIQADPRFPALAARLGFAQLNTEDLLWGSTQYRKWSEILLADFDAAHHRAVAEPFLARWPSATVSNYDSAPISQSHPIPDMSGNPSVRGGSGFGTHDSIEFYGLALRWLKLRTFQGVPLNDTPFDMFRINVHRFRSIAKVSTKPMYPWIGSWGLGTRQDTEYPSPLSLSNYWDENIIHLAMHGCDTLLLFNPRAWRPGDDASRFNLASDQARLHDVVADLNIRLASATSSRWVRLPSLNESVVATGRRVAGGTLWRFTFAPGVSGVAIARTDGTLLRVDPELGRAGAWAFELEGQTFAMKDDGTEVAMAIASDAMAWPDVNGDGSLDSTDRSALTTLNGLSAAVLDVDGNGSIGESDIEILNRSVTAWLDIARTSSLATSATLSVTNETNKQLLLSLGRPTFTFASAKSVATQRAASVSALVTTANSNTLASNAVVPPETPPVVAVTPTPTPISSSSANSASTTPSNTATSGISTPITATATPSPTPGSVASTNATNKQAAAARAKANKILARAAAAEKKAALARTKAAAKAARRVSGRAR